MFNGPDPNDNPKSWRMTPLSKMWIKRSENTHINKVIDNPNCTFLGGLSAQPFTAFYIWEKFFLEYRNRFSRFIEFGCDKGSTSVYFALHCLNNNAEYIGYDRRKNAVYKDTPVKRLLNLSKMIRNGKQNGDGYKQIDEIKETVRQDGMTVLFSDCIDKPYEFKVFAPMLKPGDVLAMHDWDRAVKDEWVEKEMSELEPYSLLYEPERYGLNTLTKFFLKG